MPRTAKPLRSDIAWSTHDRIIVHGKSLPDDLIGNLSFGDFAFFLLRGERPTEAQSLLFNAILVTLAEHGITPSAIAARMTYLGAPEALQAAVAAGLCGLGTVFVGTTEGAARMLYEAMDTAPGNDLHAKALEVVSAFRDRKETVPGIGHPIHKPVDPRSVRLFSLAEQCGMAGDYVALMKHIAHEAERATGKSLPINATGAIAAISCELGFDWKILRGFGVMARAVGLVAHLLEETKTPIAQELWLRSEEEATAHLREGTTSR